jgi:hypothetical protein
MAEVDEATGDETNVAPNYVRLRRLRTRYQFQSIYSTPFDSVTIKHERAFRELIFANVLAR